MYMSLASSTTNILSVRETQTQRPNSVNRSDTLGHDSLFRSPRIQSLNKQSVFAGSESNKQLILIVSCSVCL